MTFPSWCLLPLQPRPFPLQNLEQKPLSLETWVSPCCLRYYRPKGAVLPRKRYYHSWRGTTVASRGVKTEGVRGGSPHTPFSFFLPLSRSKGAIRGTLSGVPSPCRPSVLLFGGINPHPPPCAMDPGIAPFPFSLAFISMNFAVREILVDPLGFWLFLGTLRT